MTTESHTHLKPPKNRSRSEAAFTILEVAIAATVLAFAIATSVTALVQGIRALDNARSLTVASHILQDQLEELRTTPWATVSGWSTEGEAALVLDDSYSNNEFVTNHVFACTRAVSAVTGKASMRKVSYTVTWRGSDGKNHTRVAISYYCQSGLYDYVSN